MQLEEILGLVVRESDREGLIRLVEEYDEVARAAAAAAAGPDAARRRDSVLGQLMETIDRLLLRARFPKPTGDQVAAMAIDYCDRHGRLGPTSAAPPPLSPD